MCWFPYPYWPNGAVCPVKATDDMTQPVGIRDNRLYTAPAASGIDALAFSGNIATMAANTEYIPLTEVHNSDSAKFSISGDSIVIGDDVSLIAVSANAGSVSLGGATSIGLALYKNGTQLCSTYHALSTNGDTTTLPMYVVPVTAGDVIKLSFGAKAGASLIFSYGSVIALA